MSRTTKRALQATPALGTIVFGQVVPCDKCKRTGTYIQPDQKKVPCPLCGARGYRQWRTDEVASNAGATT